MSLFQIEMWFLEVGTPIIMATFARGQLAFPIGMLRRAAVWGFYIAWSVSWVWILESNALRARELSPEEIAHHWAILVAPLIGGVLMAMAEYYRRRNAAPT